METDRSETQLNGGHGGGNVVPFPRDWIGPTEDLVPIGSSPGERPRDDEVFGSDEELGRALGADAFWGECSASLHEAIEAPRQPLEQGLAPAAAAAAAAGRFPVWRLGRPNPRAVVVSVAVLVACCFAVAASLAALDSHHLGTRLASTFKPRAETVAGGRPVFSGESRLSRLAVERAIKRFSVGTSRRRSASAHRGSHARRPSGSARRPSTFVPVSYTSSGVTGGSVATSTAATSNTTDSTMGATSNSSYAANPSYPASSSYGSNSTSSNYSSNSSSSTAGPVGAGAPFGPGQVSSTSG